MQLQQWPGSQVSQYVEDGMKQLFDSRKPHFAVCIWIHNPFQGHIGRSERPSPIPESPLYYAVLLGLYSIVHFLVIEHSQDVKSRSVTDAATPLHLAPTHEHKQIACLLLERGADVSAQDVFGTTSLHLALQWGHVEVVHMLIDAAQIFQSGTCTGILYYIWRRLMDMWKSLT